MMATRRAHFPGVSDEARRVRIMKANWSPEATGEDGSFELMIVTSDDANTSSLLARPAQARRADRRGLFGDVR
jgi:hypothetical protein